MDPRERRAERATRARKRIPVEAIERAAFDPAQDRIGMARHGIAGGEMDELRNRHAAREAADQRGLLGPVLAAALVDAQQHRRRSIGELEFEVGVDEPTADPLHARDRRAGRLEQTRNGSAVKFELRPIALPGLPHAFRRGQTLSGGGVQTRTDAACCAHAGSGTWSVPSGRAHRVRAGCRPRRRRP